jgi:hypothetical protein
MAFKTHRARVPARVQRDNWVFDSAKHARLLNDPRPTVFLHSTNVITTTTRTTTSNQTSPRLTWLIQLITAHPGAFGNGSAPGHILKLVLFMFYTVLIMNTYT